MGDGTLTTTDATGTSWTVTVVAPLCPSLVAVIIAEPESTAVTRPVLGSTVALDGLLDAHVTTRPVSTKPPASFVVAVSVKVCPTVSGPPGGATVTVATGAAVTVNVAVPDFVSLVAVTVAVPALTPVTTPVLALIVATDVGVTDHVTVRPVRTLPFASSVTAVRGVVRCSTTEGLAGEIVTDATGIGITVIVAVPLFPSLVPVIVALPARCPVTSPLASTDAIVGALDDQATARLLST